MHYTFTLLPTVGTVAVTCEMTGDQSRLLDTWPSKALESYASQSSYVHHLVLLCTCGNAITPVLIVAAQAWMEMQPVYCSGYTAHRLLALQSCNYSCNLTWYPGCPIILVHPCTGRMPNTSARRALHFLVRGRLGELPTTLKQYVATTRLYSRFSRGFTITPI